MVDECKPLLDFMSYQLLGSANNNEAVFDDLTQPNSNAALVRHRQSVLNHLSVSTDAIAPTVTTGPSVADLKNLVEALKVNNSTVSTAPKTALTPEKRWGLNLDTLLKYSHVSDFRNLAPIWFALAKGPRKEERSIIQSTLDEQARSPSAMTSVPLLVTKELHRTIVDLMFWSGDLDRLDEGLHPFRTIYTSSAKISRDQSFLQTYDALAADGILRLEDLQLFQHTLKSKWPVDFLQLDTTLKLYGNLLLVMFKEGHPLTAAYLNFMRLWSTLSVQLSEQFGSDPSKPALFLRSIQLHISVYWQTISSSTPSQALLHVAPNLCELLRSFRVQAWVPPTMPGLSVTCPEVPVVPTVEKPGDEGGEGGPTSRTSVKKSKSRQGHRKSNGRKAISTSKAVCEWHSSAQDILRTGYLLFISFERTLFLGLSPACNAQITCSN